MAMNQFHDVGWPDFYGVDGIFSIDDVQDLDLLVSFVNQMDAEEAVVVHGEMVAAVEAAPAAVVEQEAPVTVVEAAPAVGSKRKRPSSTAGKSETGEGSKKKRKAAAPGKEKKKREAAEPGKEKAKKKRVRPPPKRLWKKERVSVWWEGVSSPECPPEEFKRAFRMSRATFDVLCMELAPAIYKADTPLRRAIPVPKRVAVCLWRLATGDSLRQVAPRFAIGVSTCHKLCIEVCAAIKNLLMHRLVQWPEGPMASAISAQFEAAFGIPDVVGAVYNTHVHIIAPQFRVYEYHNGLLAERIEKKRSYSVTVQAAVNPDGLFTDICVGQPGAMTDERVLFHSDLATELGARISSQGKWLVGGASYPSTYWMLSPYVGNDLTWVQEDFNDRVAGIRRVAKDALMRFKARWTLLRRRSEMKIDDFPVTITACCVLHNMCELFGDTLDDDLAFDLVDDDMLSKVPVPSAKAAKLRDNVANNIIINEGDIALAMP